MSDALDGGEGLDVRVDQVGEPVQVDGAAGGAEGGPGGERLGRCGDGEVGLALPAARDLAERLLVDRRESVNVLALETRSPPMKWSGETSSRQR